MSSDESVFGATSHADWAEMVAKLLGGAPPEVLTASDEDGLTVSALYEIDPTVGTEALPALQLPQAPADRVRYGWDICSRLSCRSPANHAHGRQQQHPAALETGASRPLAIQ